MIFRAKFCVFLLIVPFASCFSLTGVWNKMWNVPGSGVKRSVPSKDIHSHSCNVHQINGVSRLDIKKFSGDWHEMAKTTTSVPYFKSAVWRFQPMENAENLAFFFSARLESGHCLNPIVGEVKTSSSDPGTLQLSYDGLKGRVEEKIKLVYTDYDNIAVIYACRHVMSDTGKCHPDGVYASVLSRRHTLKESTIFSNISDTVQSICVPSHLFIPQDTTKSCQLDELEERDYKDTSSDDEWPVCKQAAVCTLTCPSCCREDQKGCIVCDCQQDTQNGCSKDVTSCPLDCHVVEHPEGCKKCICPDIGHVAPFAAPLENTEKDFYGIVSIHECPTTCRTTRREEKMFCNCTNQLICKQPMDTGSCKGSMTHYYFDARDETCHTFPYGGCEGNSNNFESVMECYATCKDVCDLPLDPGTDSEHHVERYYFNRVTEKCSEFHYKGRGGNENNFNNVDDCKMRCPEGDFQKDKQQMQVCNMAPDEGTGKGSDINYYYDPTSRKCVDFKYSGYGGNSNRFSNKSNCESKCLAQHVNTCDIDCGDRCVLKYKDCTCFCAASAFAVSWACFVLSVALLLWRK